MKFSSSWLKLEKKHFRIMAMLADLGSFKGNLTDLCGYFFLNPQNKNKQALKQSIKYLKSEGYIQSKKERNTYLITLSSNEMDLEIDKDFYRQIRTQSFSTSIAWENVIKTYLWVGIRPNQLFTNYEGADALGISESSFSTAQSVLEKDFQAIHRYYEIKKTEGEKFITNGHTAAQSAWINDNNKK